ncbi:MAG TPA: hypothetical protein DCQ14_06775 [Firmicutes bacterium]|nr:hypothetical protein [Bacillota bacterium]
MNWLDYVLLFILVFSLCNGYRLGLIKQVVGLASFFIAFYLSLRWHGLLRSYLDRYLKLDEVFAVLDAENPASLWLMDVFLNIICFLILMLLISLILSIITKRLSILNHIPIIGSLNALSGAVIGLIKGLLVISLVVSLISLLQTEFWQDTMQASAVAALSRHYIGLLFNFVAGLVEDSLGKLV